MQVFRLAKFFGEDDLIHENGIHVKIKNCWCEKTIPHLSEKGGLNNRFGNRVLPPTPRDGFRRFSGVEDHQNLNRFIIAGIATIIPCIAGRTSRVRLRFIFYCQQRRQENRGRDLFKTCRHYLSKANINMVTLYIVLIVLASFPLVLTIWRMRVAATIKKNGVYTNGVITHINTIRTRPGSMIDILTLEYKDRITGQPYKGRAIVTHQKYKMGDAMPVVYLPGKPSKYAIDTKKAYWAVLVFCVILFLFVVFAVYKINEMAMSGQL